RGAGVGGLQQPRDVGNAERGAVGGARPWRGGGLGRQLRAGSDASGTRTSKESIAARARRKAERKARREQGGGSSRQRSADRSRGRAAGSSRTRPDAGPASAAPGGAGPTGTVPRLRGRSGRASGCG